MSQDPNTLKWSQKRDKKIRRKPYSRPPPKQESLVSSVANIVKEKFIPSWLKSVANYLIFDSDNSNDVNNIRNDDLVDNDDNESGDESTNLDFGNDKEKEVTNQSINQFSIPTTSKNLSSNNHYYQSETNVPFKHGVHVEAADEDDDNASTGSSGCSSLAPTASTNVFSSIVMKNDEKQETSRNKINIPKPRSPEFIRRYLKATTRDVGIETDMKPETSFSFANNQSTLASPINSLPSMRKRKAESTSYNEYNFPPTSQNLSSSILNSSATVQKSPFYPGRTSFGGASTKRSRFAYASYAPYSTQVSEKLPIGSNNPLIEIKINNPKKCINNTLSNTAKRILEKIEQQSSPLDDVKKIPNYGQNTSHYTIDPIKPFHLNQRSINQMVNLSTINPFKSEIRENKKETTNISLKDTNKNVALEPEANYGGGKIRRMKMTSIHYTNKKDNETESITKDNLSEIKLPISNSMPIFSFSGVKVNEYSTKSDSTTTTTTTITKVNEIKLNEKENEKIEFKFSTPTLSKPENMRKESCIDNFVSPITFTEPKIIKSVKQKSETKTVVTVNDGKKFSDFLKLNENKWSCPTCMIMNDNSLLKCLACEEGKPGSKNQNEAAAIVKITENEEKTVNKIKINNSFNENEMNSKSTPLSNDKIVNKFDWGDKFKPPPSTWECDTCMVRNQDNVNKCIACETPRSGFVEDKNKQTISQSYAGYNFNKGFAVNNSVPIIKFGIQPNVNVNEKSENDSKLTKKVSFKDIIETNITENGNINKEGEEPNKILKDSLSGFVVASDKKNKNESSGFKFTFGDTDTVDNKKQADENVDKNEKDSISTTTTTTTSVTAVNFGSNNLNNKNQTDSPVKSGFLFNTGTSTTNPTFKFGDNEISSTTPLNIKTTLNASTTSINSSISTSIETSKENELNKNTLIFGKPSDSKFETPGVSSISSQNIGKSTINEKKDQVKLNNQFVFGNINKIDPPKSKLTTAPANTAAAAAATTTTTTTSSNFIFGGSSASTTMTNSNIFSSSTVDSNSKNKEGFKFTLEQKPISNIFTAGSSKSITGDSKTSLNETSTEKANNVFKFGASPTNNKKIETNIFGANTSQKNDVFSNKFSFGSTPVTTTQATNFVAPKGTTTTQAGSLFGNNQQSTNELNSTSSNFSFGSSNFSAPKPPLLFGSSASTSNKTEESGGFNFALTTASNTNLNSNPTFGFSNPKQSTTLTSSFQPSSNTPNVGFNFGNQQSSNTNTSTSSNIPFVFGSQPTSNAPAAPAFTFGNATNTNTANEFKAPVFGFTSNENKFQFGQPAQPQQTQVASSGFNFGQAPAVPSMNFSQTPSFNFGAQPNTAPQTGNIFQFAGSGQTITDNNPFAFNQGTPSATTAGRNIKKAKRRLGPT